MENPLQTIVKESGLEKTKAQVLLDNFSDYFKIAAEWEKKASSIVVTDVDQKPEMAMARVGRLFLRDKRIHIERTRKGLKEQSLRESKAIDGIANVLKALIIPLEEHLEKQEKFIEIKQAEEEERKRIEEEAKIEAERIAKEKAEEAERKRIREENIQLQKEAEERERKMIEERETAEKAKKEAEEKQRVYEERVKKDKKEAEEKAERRKIAYEESVRKEKEGREKERLEAERKQRVYEKTIEEERKILESTMIECPFCHKSFQLNK